MAEQERGAQLLSPVSVLIYSASPNNGNTLFVLEKAPKKPPPAASIFEECDAMKPYFQESISLEAKPTGDRFPAFGLAARQC